MSGYWQNFFCFGKVITTELCSYLTHNEYKFTHSEDHNNFLKAVEWTGIEECVEESMWFPVSSAMLSCYFQNKDEKVQL